MVPVSALRQRPVAGRSTASLGDALISGVPIPDQTEPHSERRWRQTRPRSYFSEITSVSGGLIALGFIGQASRLGTAFYAFGLILLPALAFVGLTTFFRVFQAGLEDVHYAQRVAQLRAFYFDAAPEAERYLLSVPPGERLEVQGIWGSRAQKFLTMAGTVAVITAILAGSAAGLLAALLSTHLPWAAFPAGVVTGTATFAVLARYLDTQIEAARRNMLADGGRDGSR